MVGGPFYLKRSMYGHHPMPYPHCSNKLNPYSIMKIKWDEGILATIDFKHIIKGSNVKSQFNHQGILQCFERVRMSNHNLTMLRSPCSIDGGLLRIITQGNTNTCPITKRSLQKNFNNTRRTYHVTIFIMTNYKQFKLLDYTLTSPLNRIIITLITTFFFKETQL